MKKILSCILISSIILFQASASFSNTTHNELLEKDIQLIEEIYKNIQINHHKIPPVIGFIDFRQPSNHKRFWIINIETGKVLLNTYVSHGISSGLSYASSFSNQINSHQSSLGAFITGETYFGKHGLSLILNGIEKGINDNSIKRHIVLHSAWYSSQEFIQAHGYLGRSWGCPSIPKQDLTQVINYLKEGHLLIQFSDQENYVNATDLLATASKKEILDNKTSESIS